MVMKRFEYLRCSFSPSRDDINRELNKLGDEGWEMCGYSHSDEWRVSRFYFKREKLQNNTEQ